MQERYIATVDLGTSKLALCVAKVLGDNVQIIYYKERPSDGMRYNCVFNPRRAAVPLRAAIAEAEDELQIRIMQVVVGFPRYGVRQETASAEIVRSVPSALIEQDEINALKNIALDTYPLSDSNSEMIYGAVPQSFSTDDVIGSEEDVVGTTSDKLSGNFKIFVGKKKSAHNIDIMLNDAGVALAQPVFTPVAVGSAVLKNDEMTNGVALMEIGAGVSSLAIYQGGIMRFFSYIPFGGKNITTDIRLECAFDDSLAENIKLAFGACMPEKLQNMGDKILQINDEENGSFENLPIKYLSEIINSRCKEIVEALLYQIQESGFADRLRCGIVLTGGTANLPNLCNLIKEMSGYNVRIGYPLARKFSSDGCLGIGEVEAATSVGLVLEAVADPYLNCTEEVVAEEGTDEEETAPVNVVEIKDEPPVRDTLFDDDEIEKKAPAKPEKPKKPKREKPAKPAGPEKDSGLTIFWKKVSNVLEKGFEGTLAGLYDDMGNNEENQQ